MFTGIVERTGKIKKIENKKGKIYFTIKVDNFLDDVSIGDSISCDGVCLTVVARGYRQMPILSKIPYFGKFLLKSENLSQKRHLPIAPEDNDFVVELMPETLRLTKFSDSREGDAINLEKAVKIGGRLDGHFVMGHVDGVGKVKQIKKDGEYIELVINAPKDLIKFLAFKGSVSINGVSLTISGSTAKAEQAGSNWLKVSLITHTLEITNLGKLKEGDKVNLEVDMIARYLEHLTRNM